MPKSSAERARTRRTATSARSSQGSVAAVWFEIRPILGQAAAATLIFNQEDIMTPAARIMRELNTYAIILRDPVDGAMTMVEHVRDSKKDGKLYTVEIKATDDGKRAIAYCRISPWGKFPGGDEYIKAHVDKDGFLCLGHGSKRILAESPFEVSWVIKRVRYWCTAYSYYKEHGVFINP